MICVEYCYFVVPEAKEKKNEAAPTVRTVPRADARAARSTVVAGHSTGRNSQEQLQYTQQHSKRRTKQPKMTCTLLYRVSATLRTVPVHCNFVILRNGCSFYYLLMFECADREAAFVFVVECVNIKLVIRLFAI